MILAAQGPKAPGPFHLQLTLDMMPTQRVGYQSRSETRLGRETEIVCDKCPSMGASEIARKRSQTVQGFPISGVSTKGHFHCAATRRYRSLSSATHMMDKFRATVTHRTRWSGGRDCLTDSNVRSGRPLQ